jgi:hypothetical protein
MWWPGRHILIVLRTTVYASHDFQKSKSLVLAEF